MSNIIFQLKFYVNGDSNNIKKMKKYRIEVELQSHELNLGRKKATINVKNYLYRRAVLIKVLSGFQSFFRGIKQGMSNIFPGNVLRGWRFQ